jgi:DNA-binding response OmpR family regulator
MILVVDDDVAIVEMLRVALAHEGYDVVTASDGLEAYDFIKSPDCQCVLLDMRMPRINGAELLLLMQANGIKVPAIVMAGFDDYKEKELKGFSNVVRYLHKPFAPSEVLKAVREHAQPPPREERAAKSAP